MSIWNASLQACALAWGGMSALAFAMDRHYAQLTGLDEVPWMQQRCLRTAGVLLLLAAWLPAWWGWSGSVSVVLVLGFWSVGALLTAVGLSVSPRGLALLATLAALSGLVTVAIHDWN